MKSMKWYVELYVEFDDEVDDEQAEDHVVNAVMKCADVEICELVSSCSEEEYEDEDPSIPIDDPPVALDATPPRLTIVKSEK